MGVDTGSRDVKEAWKETLIHDFGKAVNPKTKKTTMTSLERDLLTNEVGWSKLNSAYAEGGADLAISTI